ncbi:MAG: cysteine--tRNA ligase, partial [Desulfobacterales bacterium]
RHINRLLDENSNSDEIKTIINSIYADIRKMGDVIGILSEPAEIYFNKKKTKFIETKDVDPSLIDALVKQRFEARKAKDWKKADRIRDKLSGIDVIIEDKPEGSIWKFKS